MANNPENVEPYRIRSAEEAREKGRVGGLRSGARRRELASLKEAARLLLSMDAVDSNKARAMEAMGLDEDERTNAAMVTAAMIIKAAGGGKGSVEAYNALSKNMALHELEQKGGAPKESAKATDRLLIPPFDLSANISPAFCEVSRAIDGGIQEVILKGGRGSAKSSYAYQKQLDVFLSRPNAMWLCLRQFTNTLRRSCFANCLWAIRKRGLTIGRIGEDADFLMTVSPMEITRKATGQKIIFSGLDDPEKLKSITFEDPDKKIEILTLEEYSQFKSPENVRNAEWSVLRSDYGLEVKLFNPPRDAHHWANKEAEAKKSDPNVCVHHSTWRDVPHEFLGKRFVERAELMYETSPEAARNELDGETVELVGLVFGNIVDREITQEEIDGLKWIRCAVDWGFAADPWVWLQVAYDRKTKTILILNEDYGLRLSDEKATQRIKRHITDKDGNIYPRAPRNRIYADCEDPKSIASYRTLGLDCVGAKKWPGSVEQGLRWMQTRTAIVIDRKRCPLAYQEFTGYEYEQDPDGNVIEDAYPDKDNHTIDAARYALSPLIANKKEV